MTSRRDRILDDSARLFEERGYQSTTINDIADAVGISGPAIYKHFRSKQALLVAIAESTFRERFLATATLIIAEADSPLEALERLVELNISVILLERPRLTAAIMSEWNALPEEERSVIAEVEKSFFEIWYRIIGRVRPNLAVEHRRIMTEGLVGFIRSVCWYNIDLTAGLDAPGVVGFLTRMVVGSVLTDFADLLVPAVSSSEVEVHGREAQVGLSSWYR